MDPSVLDCYLRAGKIASSVREKSKKWVVEGAALLDAAEKIESEIEALGGKPAFPVNISIDEYAAHCTPNFVDSRVFKNGDVVKIDIGVHISGYIADTALTVCVAGGKENSASHSAPQTSQIKNLINAPQEALKRASLMAKPGVKISEISQEIYGTIISFGVRPVSNLTGHYLERFCIHAHPSIPNVPFSSSAVLKQGDVIAIEPFATLGEGAVKDSGNAAIYCFEKDAPVRSPAARKILSFAKSFGGLPFAARWIREPRGMLQESGLRELLTARALHAFPPLKEVSGGIVSQAEHTVIVSEKPIVTTA